MLNHRRLPWVMRAWLGIVLLWPNLQLALAADDADTAPPELVTRSAHERSVVALQTAGRPHFVLYARGTLSTELKLSRPTDSEWTWTGHIDHRPPGGEVQRHELTFSSQAPEELSLDGRIFPVQNRLEQKADEKPRGLWIVLTSYGRAVPTGRFFSFPDVAELDWQQKSTDAYYADMDVFNAEICRHTLEMDDLTGWILSWDEQDCISHSDGLRTARLRVFADGRVVANPGYNDPLIEKQITPGEVQALVNDILKLNGVNSRELSANVPTSGLSGLSVESVSSSPLGRGLWDQNQELIQIREDDKIHDLRVVYPGQKDRLGHVPGGWEEIRDRLWTLILSNSE